MTERCLAPSSIDDHLDHARADLDRVTACELSARAAAGALIVDIRPEAQRRRDGHLAGAVIIDRNVLEWRLAPTSDHRIPEMDDVDREVVLVCDEGFATSLAAATLRALGVAATDLAGGFQALLAHGAVPPGAPGPDRSPAVRRA